MAFAFSWTRRPGSFAKIELNSATDRQLRPKWWLLGVGVSPRITLAKEAGLTVDNGIVVDKNLRTIVSEIYAAGDIARYPDPISGESVRIEHWVLAERQGQAVARTMLGIGDSFRDAPFFWSQHYDAQISYVGHASSWNRVEIRGDRVAGVLAPFTAIIISGRSRNHRPRSFEFGRRSRFRKGRYSSGGIHIQEFINVNG